MAQQLASSHQGGLMNDSSTSPDRFVAPNRRDALKMAGAAALGGVAATVVSAGTADAIRPMAYSGHKFSVEIAGKVVANLTEVDTMDNEIQVIYGTNPSTQALSTTPGSVTATRIKITREWSNDTTFIDWTRGVMSGKDDRRTITVTILSDNGVEAMKYNFYEAWPCSYTGPSLSKSLVGGLQESIVCVYETFDYKK
jgi:phage tail-like protein